MSTFPVYLDLPRYLNNAAHAVEVASVVGGNTTLTGGTSDTGGGVLGYAAGVTTFTIVDATGFDVLNTPSATAPVEGWILDGLNSEEVIITGITSKVVTLASGTLAAHANKTCFASAGVAGCLADIIVQASREVDNICKQGPDGVLDRSLYAVSRTEIYEAPYGLAEFTIDSALAIHPYHFPVQSVATVTAQVGAMSPIGINTQYAYYPNGAREIKIPRTQPTGTMTLTSLYASFSRNAETAITLTYVGGPIVGATFASVPQDIQRACMFLVNDNLESLRKNPDGAASRRRGDEFFQFEIKGDFTGNSLLWKKAEARLKPWIRTVM